MADKKAVHFIGGFSESLWVSLVVKAVRIGWPNGIRAAAQRLNRSRVKETVKIQVFEDVYPHPSELKAVLAEIDAQDWDAVCRRDTRHAVPGLTEWTVPIVEEWDGNRRTVQTRGPDLYPQAKKYGLYLTWRLFSEFDAWVGATSAGLCPAGRVRDLDESPWAGMPDVMADMHTDEGKRIQKGRVTLLSGSEPQHLLIAKRVQAEGGWARIRAESHAVHVEPARDDLGYEKGKPVQMRMFS